MGASSFSPSPFASVGSQNTENPSASAGLQRWSSTPAAGCGNLLNDVPGGDAIIADETRAATETTLSKVNRLLDQFGLWAEKDKVYNFAQLPSQDRELVMYLNVLKLQSQLQSQVDTFDEFSTQVLQLKKYVSGNWVPSKTQQGLLTQLLGHWLIKPLRSYDKIYLRVKDFIHLRAEWLHLGVYVVDPVARTAVDKFLQDKIGDMKGTFRKEIAASIKDQKPLDTFVRTMLNKYHCPVIPNEPPRDVLAALAFLRSIVVECQSASSDTKYWCRVQAVLDELYDENGVERASGEHWKIWEDNIIATDQALYSNNPQGARLALATSRDDFVESSSSALTTAQTSLPDDTDLHGASESNGTVPMFNMYSASALPVNIPDHAMDGDVEISSLGDVAGTMEAGRLSNAYLYPA